MAQVLNHKASNKRYVTVMTQKSTNRYMQMSAQRQRHNQWGWGRCLREEPYLRRAASQCWSRGGKKSPEAQKALKNTGWLTCPQKAAGEYSYSSSPCLLFSSVTEHCPCVSVAKRPEGNCNNETVDTINAKSQKHGKNGGFVWECSLYWRQENILLNIFQSQFPLFPSPQLLITLMMAG